MTTVRRFLNAALVVVALVAAPAWAATLTWTNPATYVDGSALVSADIASTKIEWASTTAFTTVIGSQVVTGSAVTATAPDPAVGAQFCYRVSTTVVAAKGGGTSAPSNNVCKTKPFSNPSPPTLLDAIIAWLRRFFGHFA